MYEVLIERRAERDLRRVPSDVFRRFVKAAESLAEIPRPDGCKKLVGSENDWRIRIGDYRVLYEIDDAHQIVRIMRVRHRGDAYNP